MFGWRGIRRPLLKPAHLERGRVRLRPPSPRRASCLFSGHRGRPPPLRAVSIRYPHPPAERPARGTYSRPPANAARSPPTATYEQSRDHHRSRPWNPSWRLPRQDDAYLPRPSHSYPITTGSTSPALMEVREGSSSIPMDPYESNRSVTVARQSLDGTPSFAEEIEEAPAEVAHLGTAFALPKLGGNAT